MTETNAAAATGRLRVTVDSKSYWLSEHLPFVVRDARNAYVAQGTVGAARTVELHEGYYSVEAISPSGARSSQVVHIKGGELFALVIDDKGNSSPRGTVGEPRPVDVPPVEEVHDGVLAAVDLCTATQDDKGWAFSPVADLTRIPTARFVLGEDEQAWVLSLPLNPRGRAPEERECRVRIHHPPAGPAYPVATFPRQRRVSRMLDGVLRHDEVMSADLLDQAAELLLSKYADPSAAALGGLTLHRLGRLQERQGWIENLARDFTWLPDGRILCAALLMRDSRDAERARGLDMLLSATGSRPLYTDGLSLASELLRRWPGEDRRAERTERLERLSAYSSAADWRAVMLTTRETGGPG